MSRRMWSEAQKRNSEPILQVLKKCLNNSLPNLKLLDTASGNAEHASYFASHFPNITFQPSDYDPDMIPLMQQAAEHCSTDNICPPMTIDIQKPYTEWGINPSINGPFLDGNQHCDFKEYSHFFDYMLNINMMHISPFQCTEGLFTNATGVLKPGGLLITYGAYAVDGVISPESNINFDKYLRSRDSRWGIRDLAVLKEVAKSCSIELQEVVDMPANNKTCIWKKVR